MVTLLVITTLTTIVLTTLQSNFNFDYSINQVVTININHISHDESEPTINILFILKTLSSSST